MGGDVAPAGLTLRPARPEDSPVLSRIARAAKAHWGYSPDLMRLWEEDLTVTPGFVREHVVVCALHGTRIVGFYGITGEGKTRELEHLWVAPDHMGRRVGRLLLEHAVESLRGTGCRRLEIASDPNAVPFYRKLGGVRIGEVPSTPAGRTLPLLELRVR